MKVNECVPEMGHKIAFTKRANIGLSTKSGCYCISSIYDDVLYIGQTKDLCSRMDQHLKDPRMRQLTNLGIAAWFHYQEVPEDRLHVKEDELLGRHIFKEGDLPPLNRQGP